MEKLNEISAQVETGKTKLVPGLVQEAIDEGFKPIQILDAMVSAMEIVGEKFSANEIFVPEMLISAKAMSLGMDILKPHLTGEASTSLGTCIIGTVQGDLHDIGKNLVSMMMESCGFNVVDLGVDVAPEKFLTAISENEDVRVVALSGLLTTTMPAMKLTVDAIKESGLKGFKVMVGGAPVTREYANEIGADAYAPDAGGAAAMAKNLVVTA